MALGLNVQELMSPCGVTPLVQTKSTAFRNSVVVVIAVAMLKIADDLSSVLIKRSY